MPIAATPDSSVIAVAPQARSAATRTLVGACIGMFLNPSSLLLLSFGVYLLAIVKDTGWNKADVASAIGPALIIVGVMPPVIGWLTSRFGPRRFMTLGFPLCGVALMLLSTPTSASAFALTLALCGVLLSGQVMIPYVYCVSGWFDRRRGLALGTILAATGLGIAVIPPIAARLIATFGWRQALLLMGGFVVLAGVIVPRWLITDPPAAKAAGRLAVAGVAWRDALRTRTLWLLMGSLLLIGGAVSAGTINLYGILVERGVAPLQASFIMSLLGVCMIAARLVVGYLFDRVRPQRIASVVGAIVTIAFVVLANTGGIVGVVVAAALIGIGFGAEGDVLSYLTTRAFGLRDFGIIFGIAFLAFTVGGATGPVVFARMSAAAAGDPHHALWLAAGCCACGTLLISMIRDADLPFLLLGPGVDAAAAERS